MRQFHKYLEPLADEDWGEYCRLGRLSNAQEDLFSSSITAQDILNYFPDEARELIPGLINALKEEYVKNRNEQLKARIVMYEHVLYVLEHKGDTEKINDRAIDRAKSVYIQGLFEMDKARHSSNRISCLCPFHTEQTPSFIIYLNNNTYHCFGCNKSGDSIKFIMDKYNMKFLEAVTYLLRFA